MRPPCNVAVPPESSNGKNKSFTEMIEDHEKLCQEKVEKEYMNRIEELDNLKRNAQYIQNGRYNPYLVYEVLRNIVELRNISNNINKIDHMIIKKLNRYHVILKHDSPMRDAFSNFAKNDVEKDVSKRKELMKQYKIIKEQASRI